MFTSYLYSSDSFHMFKNKQKKISTGKIDKNVKLRKFIFTITLL